MAVSCTEADQVRLGLVKRSNVSASSLTMPFPASANWTRRCCGVVARDKGRRKMDASSIIFMSPCRRDRRVVSGFWLLGHMIDKSSLHGLPCSSPPPIPLLVLLLCSCRPQIPSYLCRKYRDNLLSYAQAQGP